MRLSWLADRLPLLLGVLAESALLSLAAEALAVLAAGHPAFALPGLAILVGLGAAIARRLSNSRLRSPVAVVGAIVAGLAAAVLPMGLGVEASLAAGSGPAVGAGLVGVAAFLRGSAHANATDDELAAERLLRVGTWLLVVPWVMGMSLDEARRTAFVGPAFAATTLFAASVLLALATSRLRTLASEAGVDWRGGRAWAGTLATLVCGMALFLVPASFVLGGPVQALLGLALAPLLTVLGLVLGAAAVVANVLSALIQGLAGHAPSTINVAPVGPSGSGNPIPDTSGTAGLLGVIVVAVGAAVAVLLLVTLARSWFRTQTTHAPDTVEEQRSTEVELHWPRPPALRMPLRVPRRSGPPRDAEAAYLRLLREYAEYPTLRRHDGETPTEHAARLRRSVGSSLSRDLLAADFELVRFGGRDLGARENRRAIDRWRRLRAQRH